MRCAVEEQQKQPWGPSRHMVGRYSPYHHLAVAIVEQARADVISGSNVFASGVGCLTGELMQRAALSWRWLSDPSIECKRLSFREICDGCGTDWDTALDGIDEMAEGFPTGFTRHLARVIKLMDEREAARRKRIERKQKGGAKHD